MPIRILHVVTYMGRGGLESMLMNYYRKIDREKVQFDFLVHRSFEADYDAEILSLGGKIYRLPKLNPFSGTYLKALDVFFREHKEYKIVHSHLDCMAGVPLRYAKKYGVPVRIAHAHNSNQTKDKKYLLKLFYRKNIPLYANQLFACGEEAGRWMFGTKKFHVLNNAINAEEYSYNPILHKRKREELGISENAFVIGHVGLFRPQKNHEFILDIFEQIVKRDTNSRLLLIGDGEQRLQIEQLAANKKLNDRIIFAGIRKDVPELLQAMDVFLFPSHYEGVSLSIIEAQAAGLPCLISDGVPIECRKTELVEQISLKASATVWANKVLSYKDTERKNMYQQIADAGFDVAKNTGKLEAYYLKCYNKVMGENVKEKPIECVSDTSDDIVLTVFTPAYNRAHTLPRTYKSLKKQNCKNFIWLIVDDGSSDNTGALVHEWQQEEKEFEIRYIYKENGGMHTAHNVAYDNIDTELNVCIDSDDCLAEGAVASILKKWSEVKNEGYAGMIGIDADMEGNVIGKGFPSGMTETTLSSYYANGGSGDKKLVYRTDIVNKYPPYPVFEGEKYVALAYKYRLIDQEYKLAVLDQILCNVEYQADGSSGTMWKQYLKNPKGFAFWRKVCMQYPESRKRMFVDAVHYVSSSLLARNIYFIQESPQKIITVVAIPLGIMLMLITVCKAKKIEGC